ncbi:non-ribosomal peptide synthetase [Kitasatospora sp. NPDC098663]|uniref:non-ribosomal peptide synthetase n=1 Tax=Kitasatospora sp. NPDC098663 TaxID=3364096 RepID=UPI0038240D8B
MNHDDDTFPGMWWHSVAANPDGVAIDSPATGTHTYAELHRQAESTAARLRAAGVAPDVLVGIRTADRHAFCRALLAVWLAGAVAVPLNADAPPVWVREVSERVGLAGALVDGETPGTVLLQEPVVAGARTVPGAAYVMHTSGSTGRPKPVALSHRALGAYCRAFNDAVGLSARDRFLQLAPPSFDVVFEELLPVWCAGGTAVLTSAQPDDPAQLLRELERRGVTVAELTTVYWQLLVQYLRVQPTPVPVSLRLLLMGGEQAPPALIEESLERGLPMAHVYGVTEAGITSTVRIFDLERPVPSDSVGAALGNSTVRVIGEDGVPLDAGEVGEVWIGGECLADGYLDAPAATAARFVEVPGAGSLPPGRYYRTGDLGLLDTTGELRVLGRTDAQVKVNGTRVDLTELERHLAASEVVAHAAAVAVPGTLGGATRLVAFVVPVAGTDPAELAARVRNWLAGRVPAHLVPHRVVTLDALPATAHGKVNRHRLPDLLPATGPDVPDTAWATATQRAVAEAWQGALGRPPAGPDERFAEAGGTSIDLLTWVVRLGERGIDVTAADCLDNPTVRALAAHVDGEEEQAPAQRHLATQQNEARDVLRRRRTGAEGRS